MTAPVTATDVAGDSAGDSASAARLPAFSFAFQPIVDTAARSIHAYEALIRGARNEPASQVLGAIGVDLLHRFDDVARVEAIGLAARLGAGAILNLNFLPRSIDDPHSLLPGLLETAARHGFAPNRIVLEVTEGEVIDNYAGFADRINAYRSQGMRVAIDDFGAGYSGLNLLANFQPDELKLDMQLIRGIEGHGPRQAIVRAIVQACVDLGIDVIAEGVETEDEFLWFEEEGVTLFQGYFFARPGFECLPAPYYPRTRTVAAT